MPFIILSVSLVLILAVVLIPLGIYESKQMKAPNSDYNEFYPVEYK